MKKTTSQPIIANLFKVMLAISFLAIVIIACHKNSITEKAAEGFNIQAAKEWYYGTFKRSASFFEIDQSSPLETGVTSKLNLAKYPNWNKAISYTNNGVNYVEMPLVYNTKTILLPDMQGISQTEQKRIANASVTRILFAQKANKDIVVRTVTITPTPAYARLKNYDISSNTLNHYDANFSGSIIIKDWNEKVIKAAKYNNGKLERVMHLTRRTQKEIDNTANSNFSRLECDWVWIPKIYRVCAHATSGDAPSDNEEECEDWNIVESPTQGTWDFQCTEVPDENSCDYNLAASCECQLYGIGCDGGGSDEETDEEKECKMTSEEAASAGKDAISSSVESNTIIYGASTLFLENGIEKKEVAAEWPFFYIHVGLTHKVQYSLDYTQKLFKRKGEPWKHESLKLIGPKIQSGTYPMCFTGQMDVKETANNLSADSTKASSTISYSYSLEVSCLFGMEATRKSSTLTGTFAAY